MGAEVGSSVGSDGANVGKSVGAAFTSLRIGMYMWSSNYHVEDYVHWKRTGMYFEYLLDWGLDRMSWRGCKHNCKPVFDGLVSTLGH